MPSTTSTSTGISSARTTNLRWSWPARHDMGVFVISPTDKGGHLHTPSPRLRSCAHPCIRSCSTTCSVSRRRGSTPSAWGRPAPGPGPASGGRGAAGSGRAPAAACAGEARQARREALGARWLPSWQEGLPDWSEAPGEINLPVLLWLHNLVEAWDLEGFARARYGLLGSGGHWFPGANADGLDTTVSEAALRRALADSPWREDSRPAAPPAAAPRRHSGAAAQLGLGRLRPGPAPGGLGRLGTPTALG